MWTPPRWDELDDRDAASEVAHHIGGRHFTQWRPHIEGMIRRGEYAAALDVLERIIVGLREHSGLSGMSMPTWHMSTATWLCRVVGDRAREVRLYEAWVGCEHGSRRDMWAERHAAAIRDVRRNS